MKIIKTELEGVLILVPDVFTDERGWFLETYSAGKYTELGIPREFVQDNLSKSVKNTLRGLHYQIGEFAQGKLCEVVCGEVLDVAVDLRRNSPTFGKYTSAVLSESNHNQLWIPVGFAHGFSVMSDEAVFHYKCTQYYSKEHERSVFYADPDLMINWNNPHPILSRKDLKAPLFKEIGNNIF